MRHLLTLLAVCCLLTGCAADWRSRAVHDLWNSPSGAILLRVFTFGPGYQLEPPNPKHAEELAKVQAEPQREYADMDPLLEIW